MTDTANNPETHKKVAEDALIVSKTDLQRQITYCNSPFMIYSGYYLEELLGKKHITIKHADMPESIYRHLWHELENTNEVNCVLKNYSKENATFWTFMNATPSFDDQNNHIGYLFVQRSVPDTAIEYFDQLYREMTAIELEHQEPEEAMDASYQLLENAASSQGGHNEFVFSYYA